MGAAEQQQFSQYPLRYGDGTLGAAIAQTRGGKDELVTPVALWELDDTSGLYLPPGLSQNPRRPRVDAQLSGRSGALEIERDMASFGSPPPQNLAAGATWIGPTTDSAAIDINGLIGAAAISGEFRSDQPLEAILKVHHSLTSGDAVLMDAGYGLNPMIPWQTITLARYHWEIKNIGAAAATFIRATERLMAVPFLDTGFIQTFPLDSGGISVASGATYASPLFTTRRMSGGLTLGISCPASADVHTVALRGQLGSALYIWVEAASKVTYGGRDYYSIHTPKIANLARVLVTNNAAIQVDFQAAMYGAAG